MRINQYVDLNLSASVMPPVLHMVQGDGNSRNIVATLWNGTSGFTIPADAAVMVRFGKPDGTGGLYDHTEAGDAISYSGNVVTAPVATQMLTAAGKVQANVEIYQTGATDKAAVRLATFTFFVNVEKSAYPDAEIISSDYFNILSAEIAAAVGAGAKADQAIQAAEDAEEAATAAGQSAAAAANSATASGNSANAANTAKAGAEAAKTAAESAKTAAQQAQGSAETEATNAANSANAANTAKTGAETAKTEAEAAKDAAEAAQEAAEAARDEAETIAGGEYVSYGAAQTLTNEQKSQAKTNIGLGNVDNTSDEDKPISTAMQTALNAKQGKLTAGQGISLSGNTIDTKVYPCNPNILINWCFLPGCIVNQLRQTSYTNPAGGSGVEKYGYDMWDNRSVKTTATSDGLLCEAVEGSSPMYIFQNIDNANYLKGRTVTLSFLLSGISGYSGDFTIGVSNSTASTYVGTTFGSSYHCNDGLITVTCTIPSDATLNFFNVWIRRPQNETTAFTVIAAKLELGASQTLAYRDANGNWALTGKPSYNEELLKCQRYLYVIYAYHTYSPAGMAYSVNATTAHVLITIPVTMRAHPVVTYTGGWQIQGTSGDNPITALSNDQYSSSEVRLLATSSGLSVGSMRPFRANNSVGATIVLSAKR